MKYGKRSSLASLGKGKPTIIGIVESSLSSYLVSTLFP